jgi:hypothetical protein
MLEKFPVVVVVAAAAAVVVVVIVVRIMLKPLISFIIPAKRPQSNTERSAKIKQLKTSFPYRIDVELNCALLYKVGVVSGRYK